MSKVWIVLALLIPSLGHADMAWEFAQRWHAASAQTDLYTDGLTAWWKPKTTGNMEDQIGTNNATLYDGALVDSKGLNLTKSGTDPKRALASTAVTDGSWTISTWIFIQTLDDLDWYLSQRTATENQKFHLYNFGSSRLLTATIWNTSGNSFLAQKPTVANTNSWHHTAVSFDQPSGKLILYYDGAAVATNTLTGTIQAAGTMPFCFGTPPWNPLLYPDCWLDDIRVYDGTAKDAEFILGIFESTSGSY